MSKEQYATRLPISREVHTLIKMYCAEKGMKVYAAVAELILAGLEAKGWKKDGKYEDDSKRLF